MKEILIYHNPIGVFITHTLEKEYKYRKDHFTIYIPNIKTYSVSTISNLLNKEIPDIKFMLEKGIRDYLNTGKINSDLSYLLETLPNNKGKIKFYLVIKIIDDHLLRKPLTKKIIPKLMSVDLVEKIIDIPDKDIPPYIKIQSITETEIKPKLNKFGIPFSILKNIREAILNYFQNNLKYIFSSIIKNRVTRWYKSEIQLALLLLYFLQNKIKNY